tara:strand:+ start:2330 stop:3283 length:954 start_codon:yes stop_codon:yes gene_type:complete
MSHQVQKTITWLLRHGASQENVPIDEDGFITINNLINWLKKKNIHLNKQDINNIVASDKKTRYLLKDDMIRANQGHSIKLQIQMDSFKQNNSQLVHATYYDNMESIQKSGLKSMSRNDVHLINIDSKNNKFKMIRQDTDLYVFVNGHNLDLKESTNGVILTPSVPPENLITVPAYEYKKSNCYGFLIFNSNMDKILTVKTPAGHIGFPKGKKDFKNELPLCCAFRELKEETNLDPEDIQVLPGCKSEVNDKDNVPTNYYIAKIRDDNTPVFCNDQDENLQLQWININKLLTFNDFTLYHRRKLLVKEYLYEYFNITL